MWVLAVVTETVKEKSQHTNGNSSNNVTNVCESSNSEAIDAEGKTKSLGRI